MLVVVALTAYTKTIQNIIYIYIYIDTVLIYIEVLAEPIFMFYYKRVLNSYNFLLSILCRHNYKIACCLIEQLTHIHIGTLKDNRYITQQLKTSGTRGWWWYEMDTMILYFNKRMKFPLHSAGQITHMAQSFRIAVMWLKCLEFLKFLRKK